MKMMKASKNFRNSKKDIYVHKSSLGDVEMYNSADHFFLGRRWIDPCGGVKDRDMVQELQTGGDDVEFRD